MTTPSKCLSSVFAVATALILNSCFIEDPGPLQQADRDFSVVDFDRLEMSDALYIEVQQGNFFEVSARGDRRNIEDLKVEKVGSTLVVRYKENGNRRHDTHITVTMPQLYGVNFSGASDSRIQGFNGEIPMKLNLSGASVCQFDAVAGKMDCLLSGASYLSLRGEAQSLAADISGASVLNAFDFPVSDGHVVLSGASEAKVTVSDNLTVTATGASSLTYRGDPSLQSDLSGASSVHHDGGAAD
jgi:hypothetical protein